MRRSDFDDLSSQSHWISLVSQLAEPFYPFESDFQGYEEPHHFEDYGYGHFEEDWGWSTWQAPYEGEYEAPKEAQELTWQPYAGVLRAKRSFSKRQGTPRLRTLVGWRPGRRHRAAHELISISLVIISGPESVNRS